MNGRDDIMKQVQIDEQLFKELIEYFFSEDVITDSKADNIRQQLNEKLDKLIARELFTKYKRAITVAEREEFRKEYLQHKGISSKFISETEVKYKNM